MVVRLLLRATFSARISHYNFLFKNTWRARKSRTSWFILVYSAVASILWHLNFFNALGKKKLGSRVCQGLAQVTLCCCRCCFSMRSFTQVNYRQCHMNMLFDNSATDKEVLSEGILQSRFWGKTFLKGHLQPVCTVVVHFTEIICWM